MLPVNTSQKICRERREKSERERNEREKKEL